ncbi:TPA: DUF2252 family protein [Methanosarcina acetivorans]|uniref:DUF2252 family protein n=1 Tax=Methanosarcina acetivorans TaxID=2214 RepID=A0A832SFI7_9EURY|nr:DUF2252 family protein [Methanosarcina acetivorans]HIH94636.1 DUF2252 family protein [Methanosarcina acetivorans]
MRLNPGPWEWDLKRLAASSVIAGRENGFGDSVNRKLANVVGKYYGRAIERLSQTAFLDCGITVEVDKVLEVFEQASKRAGKNARKAGRKARESTQEHTMVKLTKVVNNRRQIRNNSPPACTSE